jgi:hypothetical protein
VHVGLVADIANLYVVDHALAATLTLVGHGPLLSGGLPERGTLIEERATTSLFSASHKRREMARPAQYDGGDSLLLGASTKATRRNDVMCQLRTSVDAHSITSSASATTSCGRSMPSARAVRRLITISNLVGRSKGM